MTNKDKFYASELKERIYFERNGACEVCGKIIPFGEAQLAHRVAKTKANIRKYGEDFIHSSVNLALTCPGACNDTVNIGFNPVEIQKVLDEYKNSQK